MLKGLVHLQIVLGNIEQDCVSCTAKPIKHWRGHSARAESLPGNFVQKLRWPLAGSLNIVTKSQSNRYIWRRRMKLR